MLKAGRQKRERGSGDSQVDPRWELNCAQFQIPMERPVAATRSSDQQQRQGALDVHVWRQMRCLQMAVRGCEGRHCTFKDCGHIRSCSPSPLQVVQNKLLLFFFVVCFRQFWKFGMAQSTWYTSALIRNANFEWRHQSWKTTNKTYYILIFVIDIKEDCSTIISLTTWWHLDEKQIYHLSSANPAYFYEVLQKLRTEMKSKKAKKRKRKENHLQNKSMTLIPEVLWLWLVQLWLQVQGVRSWLFCPLPMLTVQAVTPCRSAASDWLRWAWHWWWKPWRRRRSGFSWHTSVDSSSSGGLGAQRRQDERD